jgi:hypothetical protein
MFRVTADRILSFDPQPQAKTIREHAQLTRAKPTAFYHMPGTNYHMPGTNYHMPGTNGVPSVPARPCHPTGGNQRCAVGPCATLSHPTGGNQRCAVGRCATLSHPTGGTNGLRAALLF